MKKLVVLFLMVLMLVACDFGDNEKGESFSLDNLSVKDTSIKSLFLGNVPVNSGRAVSGSTIQTLAYINGDGTSSPFSFTTPSGKNIVLEVSSFRQLGDKRMQITFRYYYTLTDNGNNTYSLGDRIDASPAKTALVDFENNKVYDFTDWSIIVMNDNNVIAHSYTHKVENGSVGNGGILYKIDLNNISIATPLNNPQFYNFNFANCIQPPLIFGNKIVVYTGNNYIVDINNAFPITARKYDFITNDMCSFVPEDSPCQFSITFGNENGILLQDLNGECWFFITGGMTPDVSSYATPKIDYGVSQKYFFGKVSISDTGYISLTDCNEGEFSFTPNFYNNGLYNNDYSANYFVFRVSSNGNSISTWDVNNSYNHNRIIMCNDGYISIKRKINGLQVESTLFSTSISNLKQGQTFIKDDYLYYLDNSSIKRIYLSAGSSAETIYTNNRILADKEIVLLGDTIIFYQFADDNVSVNTFSLSLYQQNTTPKLLSTSSVEIIGIVELDF